MGYGRATLQRWFIYGETSVDHIMAKNEKSSPKMAKLASKVLSTSKSKPARSLAASVLTQAADKKKPAAKKK